MGDLFSWQIKENFFLFDFFLKPDKTVPKIPFLLKVLAWIMQKDVLWILLVKSYRLLEGNIFLWKGIIFCPFQRSIAFYAASLWPLRVFFQNNNHGNFSHFWAVRKTSLSKDIQSGTVEPRYNDMPRDIVISRSRYIETPDIPLWP